jgi:hypothetical protein
MRRLFLLAVVIMLLLAACSGGDGEDETGGTPVGPPTLTPSRTPQPLPPTWTPEVPTQTAAAVQTQVQDQAQLTPITAGPTPTPAPTLVVDTNPRTQAQLRVANALIDPNLLVVDLYLNQQVIRKNLRVGQAMTDPLTFGAGDYELLVLPAGARLGETDPIAAYDLVLTPRQDVILILTGTARAVDIITYEPDRTPLPEETARLTVMNAIPQGEPFTVIEDNATVVASGGFGQFTTPVELSAGQHIFDLVRDPTLLTARTLTMREGVAYLLLVLPTITGDDYQVLDIPSPVNTTTPIRVINTAFLTETAVDVYLDDIPVARTLDYRMASEWAELEALVYNLRVVPADQPDAAPLYQERVNLANEEALNLVLYDAADGDVALFLAPESRDKTPVNGASFTFINSLLGRTRIGVQTGDELLPDVAPVLFASATDPLVTSMGENPLVFVDLDTGERRIVDRLPAREWPPGYTYTIVITGYPQRSPLVLETNVGTTDTRIVEDDVVAIDGDEPDGLTFQLQMINALTDGRRLDLLVEREEDATGDAPPATDTTPIFTDIAPETATLYRTLSTQPGVMVLRDAATGDVLQRGTFTWEAGAQFTLYAYLDANGDVQLELALNIARTIPAGRAQVQVFNAAVLASPDDAPPETPELELLYDAPDLPSGAVGDIGTPIADLPTIEQRLGPAARFGQPTDPDFVLPGTYEVRIAREDTEAIVVTVPQVTFEAGVAYDLLLLPDSGGLSARLVTFARQP